MRNITADDVRKLAMDLIADDELRGPEPELSVARIEGICALNNAIVTEMDIREQEAERELEEWRRKQAEKAAAEEA